MERTGSRIIPQKGKRRYWVLLGLLLFLGSAGLALPFAHHLPFYDRTAQKVAFVEAGKAHFEEGRREDARIAFRNALQMDPSVGEAYYYLGLMALEAGRLREALVELALAVRYAPDLIEAQIRQGEIHFLAGDMEQASQKAMLIVGSAPDRPEGYLLQGKVRMLEGDRIAAAESVTKALQVDSLHLESSMVLASLHMHAGKPALAEGILKRAVEHHPSTAKAYAGLGAFYESAGNPEKAEQVYTSAVGAASDNSLSHFVLGRFLMTQNRGEAALAQFRHASRVDPHSAWIRKHLTHSLLTQGELAGADSLSRTLGDPSGDLDVLYLRGRILLAQGRPQEAVELLREVSYQNRDYRFSTYPHDLGYHLGVGYFADGQIQEARQEVQQLLVRYPASSHLQLLLADLSLKLGDDDQVIQATRRVLRTHPDNLHASLLMGQSSLRAGNRSQAQSSLNRVIESTRKVLLGDPQNLQASLLLVQTLAQVGNLAEAERLLTKTVAAHAEDVDVHIGRGQFYYGLRDYERAEQAYLAALGLAPRNSRVHLALGRNHALLGRLDSAEVHLIQALKIDPELLGARKELAHLCLQQNRVARADSLATGILANRSGDIDGLYLKGRARLAQGEAEEAMALLLQVSRKNPAYQFGPAPSDLSYYLGLACYESGRFTHAKEELNKAVRHFPHSPQAHRVLGATLLALGNEDEAEGHLRKSIELGSVHAQPHFLLGTLYEKRGALQPAVERYEKALGISPQYAPAANNLAWLLAEAETDLDRARYLAEMAQRQRPDDPNVLDTLGWVHYKSRNYPSAVGFLEQCVRMRPSHSTYHFHLGMAYHKNGDLEAARNSLEESLKLDPAFPKSADSRRLLASMGGNGAGR